MYENRMSRDPQGLVKSKERERAGQISAQIRADQSAHLRSESAAQIRALSSESKESTESRESTDLREPRQI